MYRTSVKWLVLGAIIVAILGMSTTESQACWWGHRAWGYGWGGYYYAPYYSYYAPVSYCYPSCYPTLGCGWGCGYSRCCGYGYGYGVSVGYASYDYGTCCDGSVAAPAVVAPSSSAPTLAPPASPAVPKPPAPAATQPSGSPSDQQPGALPRTGGSTSVRTNSALLTIAVPADAKVLVNGYQTKSTGSVRQYISYGLQPGLSYNYEIRAEIYRGGRLIEQVRNVTLASGSRADIAIRFEAKSVEGLASAR